MIPIRLNYAILTTLFILFQCLPYTAAIAQERLRIISTQTLTDRVDISPEHTVRKTFGHLSPARLALCDRNSTPYFTIDANGSRKHFYSEALQNAGLSISGEKVNELALLRNEAGLLELDLMEHSFPNLALSFLFMSNHQNDLDIFESQADLDDQSYERIKPDLSILARDCGVILGHLFPLIHFWNNTLDRQKHGADLLEAQHTLQGHLSRDFVLTPNSPTISRDGRVQIHVLDGRPETLISVLDAHLGYWRTVREQKNYNWSDLYFLEGLKPEMAIFSTFAKSVLYENQHGIPRTDKEDFLTLRDGNEKLDGAASWIDEINADLDSIVAEYIDELVDFRTQAERLAQIKSASRQFSLNYMRHPAWTARQLLSLPEGADYRAGDMRGQVYTREGAQKQLDDTYAYVQGNMRQGGPPWDGSERIEQSKWIKEDINLWNDLTSFSNADLYGDLEPDTLRSVESADARFIGCLKELYKANSFNPSDIASLIERSYRLIPKFPEGRIRIQLSSVNSDKMTTSCDAGAHSSLRDYILEFADPHSNPWFRDRRYYSDYGSGIRLANAIKRIQSSERAINSFADATYGIYAVARLRADQTTEIDLVQSFLDSALVNYFGSRLVSFRDEYVWPLQEVGFWDDSGSYQYASPSRASYTFSEERSQVSLTYKDRIQLLISGSEDFISRLEFSISGGREVLLEFRDIHETVQGEVVAWDDRSGLLNHVNLCGIALRGVSKSVSPGRAILDLELDPNCRNFEPSELPYSNTHHSRYEECIEKDIVYQMNCFRRERAIRSSEFHTTIGVSTFNRSNYLLGKSVMGKHLLNKTSITFILISCVSLTNLPPKAVAQSYVHEEYNQHYSSLLEPIEKVDHFSTYLFDASPFDDPEILHTGYSLGEISDMLVAFEQCRRMCAPFDAKMLHRVYEKLPQLLEFEGNV